MINKLRSSGLRVLPGLCLFFILGGTAYAQYSSSNYRANELLFGSGGGLTSSSGYQAQQSLGNLGGGRLSSSAYQNYPGTITPETPFLEFVVNTSSVNIGVVSTSAPATATATFHVKTYLANGYIVTTNSPPPKNGSYTMHNLSSPTTSSTGTEQFGINLVANNSCPQSGMPGSLGASPIQVPDSTFSFGFAATNYNTACSFTYNNGDTIAQSNSSSGETDYTISYLFNISSVTPGGSYTMSQNLVATSTF
ncbi:MAG TPA: hypothetical protein VFK97_02255 [Candidatus Saccharimonadales bacterium]|nr:hypothetical protein [Candidatus Saccharimonadales bacterium]